MGNFSTYINTAFETTALLKFANLQYFPLVLFVRFNRVTDEASIAVTHIR